MEKGVFKKSIYLNIVIAFISFLISLICVELLLRYFLINDLNINSLYFISEPALQDQEKKYGFKENTEIREVAVYWNGKNYQVEFDNYFTTNNLGLVQKNPFDPKKETIVVIGDSFTQGMGSIPWFYKLEENWQDSRYQLINLGTIATGIEQWKYMLNWFADFGKIKHIFICFISDDWERMRWVPRDDLKLNGFKFVPWNQRNDIIHNQNFMFYYIDKDTSIETILNKSESIRINLSKHNFHTFKLIKKVILDRKLYYIKKGNIFKISKISLEEIVSAYGYKNITLFHIPQRDEVIQRSYNALGQKIKEFISSHDLEYIDGLSLCGLKVNDYYEHDCHPNASGYDKIYKCLLNHGIRNLN